MEDKTIQSCIKNGTWKKKGGNGRTQASRKEPRTAKGRSGRRWRRKTTIEASRDEVTQKKAQREHKEAAEKKGTRARREGTEIQLERSGIRKRKKKGAIPNKGREDKKEALATALKARQGSTMTHNKIKEGKWRMKWT